MKLLHSMSYSAKFSGFEYYYLFASIQFSLYTVKEYQFENIYLSYDIDTQYYR